MGSSESAEKSVGQRIFRDPPVGTLFFMVFAPPARIDWQGMCQSQMPINAGRSALQVRKVSRRLAKKSTLFAPVRLFKIILSVYNQML
jgi:hypothetical protein